MVLKTTYGVVFNPDKIWGIEWGHVCKYNYNNYKKGDIFWSSWSSYDSQRKMLQAIKDIRKQDNYEYFFRTVHIDYTEHLDNLDTKSKREYYLNKLL